MATNTEKIVVQVQVKGQKELNNLSKSTKKATKSAGGLTKGMAKMAAGVMAAVVAFKKISSIVSSVVKSWQAFEFQMAKVKAITGANDTQFKMLSDTAQQLGRTTFFTATQVSELQTNYGKLGFTTGEILNAQKATLALATATDTDLARAAIVAGAAVRGFGLDASETGRVTDVMAASFTSSAMDIEKWQTSMTKVAPIAAAAGISIESTAAVMSTLTDTGIEASIAGTSLRNILLKMQDTTSDLSQHLGFTVNSSADLQRALTQLNKEGLSNEEVMGLVDLRQVAAFNTMIRGSETIDNLTESFFDANGQLDRMVEIIEDTLEGDTKKLTSAMDGLQQEVGEELSPALREVIQNLTELTNEVTDDADAWVEFFKKLGKSLKESSPLRLLEKQLIKVKETLNTLTGTEGWRDLGEYLGIISPKDQGAIDAAERLKNLAFELQTLLDLTDSNIENTKKNIDKIHEAIKAREKELELIKGTEGEDAERERLARELEALTENLALRKDRLYEFEQEKIELAKITRKSEEKIKKDKAEQDAKDAKKAADKLDREEKKKEKEKEQAFKKHQEQLDNFLNEELIKETQKLIDKEITEEQFRQREFELQQQHLTSLMGLRHGYEKDTSEVSLNILNNELAFIEATTQARKKELDTVAGLGDQLIQLAGEDEKMQGIRKAGIAISSAAAIANNIEALSLAGKGVASQSTQPFPKNIIGMVTTLATLISLFSNIKAMKDAFGDGGVVDTFANGGMVHGRSHANGGEKFAVGGRVVELEGGEAVINKRSTSMFRNQLSAMNSAGGGVKFADGGLLNMPSFSQQQFNALGQNQMVDAIGGSGKVVVVEADITTSQNTVSVIQSEATI